MGQLQRHCPRGYRQQQQQQQQQKAAAAQSSAKSGSEGPAAKRQKASEQLPPAPDDAVSLYDVLYKASKAGVNLQASTPAPSSAAAAAAGGGGGASAAEGPSTSIEELLRRAEHAGRAVPDALAARGWGGADEEHLISDAALRRLMELQGVNKVGGLCCLLLRMESAAQRGVVSAVINVCLPQGWSLW